MPIKAAPNTGANSAFEICHSSNKGGAIKPIIPVSSPSQKNTKKPKTKTTHWRELVFSIYDIVHIYFNHIHS